VGAEKARPHRKSGGRGAVVLLLLCGLPVAGLAASASPPLRYATTPFLEPDRCATAWVVRRYLHPDAVFEFHPHEAMPEGVVLYDLPEAEFKRDARRTTVERLVQKSGLTDPFVARLVRLIHDIEINAWARRDQSGSLRFQQTLMSAIGRAGSASAALPVCFELLDRLRDVQGDVDRWAESLRPVPTE